MKRTLLLYALLVAFFWGFVHDASARFRHHPTIQAAFRYSPYWCEESVWKYTGPHPGKGEQLVLYWRTANRYEPKVLRLHAYLGGSDGAPDMSARQLDIGSDQRAFFDFGRAVIPDWPADRPLFLGLQWPKNANTWWETGDWPSAPLEPLGWERKAGEKVFKRASRACFGCIDVHVEPAGSQPAMDLASHTGWIRNWGIGALLLFAAGLLIAPREQRSWWHLALGFFLAMGYQAFSVLHPDQYFWGGYYISRLGARWFWGGLVVVQLLLLPGVLPAAWGSCARLLSFVPTRLRRPLGPFAVAVITVCLTAACWAFPSRGMYGDGFGPLGAPGYGYHNPLALALYTIFREHFGKLVQWHNAHFKAAWPLAAGYGDMDWLVYFQILFTPLFVVSACGIARHLGRTRTERLVLGLILLTGKTILTQFRYYEIYGPALAVSAFAIWMALRADRRGRELIFCSVVAFLAYIFHLGFAPFVFVVLMLWLSRWWQVWLSPRWLLPRAAVTAVLALFGWINCCIILYTMRYHWDWAQYRVAVPQGGLAMLHGWTGIPPETDFLHRDEAHMFFGHFYPWQSLRHLSQWTMAHAFALGPVLPVGALLTALGIRRALSTALGWGFTLASTFFLASSFFLFTSFPYPKDWDFLSQNALVLTVTFLLLASRLGCVRRPTARWLLGALLVHQVWDTGMWLAYNLTWGPPAGDRNFVFF